MADERQFMYSITCINGLVQAVSFDTIAADDIADILATIAVTSITSTDSSLTPSASVGSVDVVINVAHANAWTASQTYTSGGKTLSFGASTTTITTTDTQLILSQSGDTFGTSSLTIQNRSGLNGAQFYNSSVATGDVVDFSFKGGSSASNNFRWEGRTTSVAESVFEAVAFKPDCRLSAKTAIGVHAENSGQTVEFDWYNYSSVADYRIIGADIGSWATATDASRAGQVTRSVYYITTAQEYLRAVAASGGVTVTIGNDANFLALVVNENGNDADVRIEGDTATSLFVCDAGLEAVQIGTTTAGAIADFRPATIVFNEASGDIDFRVEGNGDANLLFCDASTDRVGIGTATPATTLDVNGAITCTNIDTGNGAVELAAGSYTPTLSNTVNLDASTAFASQYMRVGTVVTVSGRVDIDPTAAGDTQLGISLPIASNFANDEECAGTAFCNAIAGQGAAILGDATNNRATMQWIAADTTSQRMYYHFTYRII